MSGVLCQAILLLKKEFEVIIFSFLPFDFFQIKQFL